MKRRGYTLVEVVLATGLLAVILLGAQSAVVIAARAIPSGTSGSSAVASASAALGTMGDDLPVALSIDTMTATDIQFVVPDRTGDTVNDTIRYVWSGIAGDPLKRIVNGGAAQVAAAGVQDFALAYDTAQVALPATWSDGPEVTLFSYVPTSPANTSVKSSKWWAQYFEPTLPGSARSWSITRAVFSARRHSGNTGQANAQIRLDASGVPSSIVLGEFPVLEGSLGSNFGAATTPYSFVSGLSPGRGVWFVLQWVSDTDALDFEYKSGAGVGAGAPMASSGDGGASWSVVSNSEMTLTVYGKVGTQGPTQYQTVVSGVRCRLRTGATDATSLTQSWRILNQPVAH